MASPSFKDFSDAELIIASVRDPEAFCALYDRWAQPLLRYIYRRVGNPEVAADLLAETLAVVFERRARFRDTGHPGSSWLYTIASREVSRYYRRRKVELKAVQRLGVTVPLLDHESVAALEALAAVDPTQGASLSAAMRQMPSGEREAVELRVVQELGYEEIASRLNCSVVAARVRVHRGMSRLSRLMEVMS